MLLGLEHGLVFVIKCSTLMRCLPQTAPTAAHEYLYCPLRVPAAFLGLLNFAARSKMYLRYYVVGCFTIADSLSACHSLLQYDNKVQKLAVAEFVHFIPRNNFL